MIASVGSRIVGSGRSSTRTSPGPYMTRHAWMRSPSRSEVDRAGGRPPAAIESTRRRRRARKSLSMGVPTGHPSRSDRGRRRTVDGVDNRTEVREFLISRRAKITPRAGRAARRGQRRVPGLRRSEVAALAGVSVEYYAKLERGTLAGASACVLDAIARALQLDDAERAHLFHLARAADGTSALHAAAPPPQPSDGRRGPACSGRSTPSPPARRSSATAAWTCSPPTTSAAPCYADLYDATRHAAELRPVHLPRRRRRTGSTPTGTPPPTSASAILRTAAGQDPHDKGLHDLVGELSTRSDDFRRRWGCPQRPHPRRRHQALPPPRRRRPRPRLRKPRPALRTRPHHDHLRRRTRLTHRPRPRPARLLGQHGDRRTRGVQQ